MSMPILKVPMDYYRATKKNPIETARNIFSIPVGTVTPFLNADAVSACIDKDMPNPFNPETWIFDDDFYCKDTYARYMHIDYGQKINATGISMCHIVDFKKVVRVYKDDSGEIESQTILPVFKFDFIAKIYAPVGGEVLLPDIRELIIYELSRRGFNLKLISYDGFGSLESVQILVNEGYACDRLSIDRTATKLVVDYSLPNKVKRITTHGNYLAAWNALKEAFYDKRIICPYIEALDEAIKHAERRIHGSKVTIESSSASLTLDLLESMAGSVFNAMNNEPYTEFDESEISSEADMKAAAFYKEVRGDITNIIDEENVYSLTKDGDEEWSSLENFYPY